MGYDPTFKDDGTIVRNQANKKLSTYLLVVEIIWIMFMVALAMSFLYEYYGIIRDGCLISGITLIILKIVKFNKDDKGE
jgi:hypothetical protein